jgi:hypothetical protein
MRFIIMHTTNAHWESGAAPTPDLVARVGGMLGEIARDGRLLAGEGLRASSQGVRLVFVNGARTVIPGPFTGDRELPAGFSIIRVPSLDAAVEWATRQARVLGDVEIDIRPVTEAWDIGMAPVPAEVRTRRYMVLRKATPATEAGTSPTPGERAGLLRLVEETSPTGVHLVSENLRPSSRGRRYKNSRDGVSYFDGPFAETTELLGGYVIVSADSLDTAGRLAERYIAAVGAETTDVRELE